MFFFGGNRREMAEMKMYYFDLGIDLVPCQRAIPILFFQLLKSDFVTEFGISVRHMLHYSEELKMLTDDVYLLFLKDVQSLKITDLTVISPSLVDKLELQATYVPSSYILQVPNLPFSYASLLQSNRFFQVGLTCQSFID